MLRGVLFDMDGVLFDTERLYMEANRQAARQMGLPEPGNDMLRQLCGLDDARTCARFTALYGPGFDFPDFSARSRRLMDAWVAGGRLKKKPGLDEALRWLREHDLRLAVATSTPAPQATRTLEQGGVLSHFEAVISGDMVQRGKPDPEIYLLAAAALGLATAQCAAVEDSFAGVRSAAAAGCVTIMMPDQLQPTSKIRSLCAAVLQSMLELPAFLQRYQSMADDTGAS